MTQQEEETESRLSEMRLWVGALTALVVVVLSIVGFSSVDHLIVREDGSVARGSGMGGRVYNYLAPRIQGQRFWREQLVIVRERLDKEEGAVERYAELIRVREQMLAKDLQVLDVAAGKERSSLLSIDPRTGQTLYDRALDAKVKSFEKDIDEIVTTINQYPEKYQRLEAIERAILKRLEK